MGKIGALFIGTLLVVEPIVARAQTADAPPPATDAVSPICTDRPTKTNVPCTVDEGHWQYESDLFNGTFQRTGGVSTDTYLITNPTLKYGVTKTLDLEVNIAPYEVLHTQGGGTHSDLGSVGDLYLRLKYNFYSNANGVLTASVIPYVKAPTARIVVGDGAVEAGVLVPIAYKLSDKLTLSSVPELDGLKNSTGDGRHLNTAQLLDLSYSLPLNVTVFGEVWGDWNFDPAGTVRQYSADMAVAWSVTNTLQWDGGLNLGLNRATPGLQAYIGVSQKF